MRRVGETKYRQIDGENAKERSLNGEIKFSGREKFGEGERVR